MWARTKTGLLLMLLIALFVGWANSTSAGIDSTYLEVPPVKLLTVQSFAERYPAAQSEYRISMEDGAVSRRRVEAKLILL